MTMTDVKQSSSSSSSSSSSASALRSGPETALRSGPPRSGAAATGLRSGLIAPGIDTDILHHLEAHLPSAFDKFVRPERRKVAHAYDDMSTKMTDWIQKNPEASGLRSSGAGHEWTPDKIVQFLKRKETPDETRQVGRAALAPCLLGFVLCRSWRRWRPI
jgi:hypothetical protein